MTLEDIKPAISSPSAEGIEWPPDNDSEIINEILMILNRKKLTVIGARRLLEKATWAVGLTKFKWVEKEIPMTLH